jgi:hypothetical protein
MSDVAQAATRCHYSGLAYCSDCMTSQVAMLPALAVRSWDFSKKPVSGIAADFLTATHQQPLLCLNTLNPGRSPLPLSCSKACLQDHSTSYVVERKNLETLDAKETSTHSYSPALGISRFT